MSGSRSRDQLGAWTLPTWGTGNGPERSNTSMESYNWQGGNHPGEGKGAAQAERSQTGLRARGVHRPEGQAGHGDNNQEGPSAQTRLSLGASPRAIRMTQRGVLRSSDRAAGRQLSGALTE